MKLIGKSIVLSSGLLVLMLIEIVNVVFRVRMVLVM